MPAGERHQVWYPALVTRLRAEWRVDLSWDAIVALRGELQAQLEGYRAQRGIVPAIYHCPHCGTTAPGAPPVISVRALLLAVGRFGIDSRDVVRARERAWAAYRAHEGLNLYGSRDAAEPSDHHHAKA